MANPVAHRYAQAYFDLAAEAGEIPKWRGELARAIEAVDTPEVQRVLSSPKLKRGQREKSVAELLDGVAPQAVNLMRLLVGRNRISYTRQILAEYQRLADVAAGIIRAEVTAAVPVTDELEEDIRNKLKNQMGSSLEVSVKQDSSIVGGLIIRIGDRVIDNSLRTHIAQLRTVVAR
jgi:F-type H+-transporting ATPase subunit delta